VRTTVTKINIELEIEIKYSEFIPHHWKISGIDGQYPDKKIEALVIDYCYDDLIRAVDKAVGN